MVLIFVLGLSACSTADPAPIDSAQIQTEAVDAPGQDDADMEAEGEAEAEAETAAEELEAIEGVLVFQIVEDGTEARFIIDEVLRGSPNSVVGTTNKVTGEISVNLEDPSSTEVGSINVEAGTLRTDNNFRNGAIQEFILQTGSFLLITFTPTSIVGLPGDVAVGDAFSFDMTGDLMIRDITQQVTFEVHVTAESENVIKGSAATMVLRGDYGITIPSVPQVASVDNEVFLELDFTATR
jgi:polyisoprenoid-binding protein YceI